MEKPAPAILGSSAPISWESAPAYPRVVADTRTRAEQATEPPPRAETGALHPLFFNRELSWLDFNARVLELAEDATLPLLERVKFLAIFASNLDEFFMKRVGGLQRQRAARISTRTIDGLTPEE